MHRPRIVPSLFALLGAAIVAGSWGGCARDVRVEEWSLEAPPRAAGGGPAVDVECVRGGVAVRVDPLEDEIEVEAVIRATGDTNEAIAAAVGAAVHLSAALEDRGGLPVLVVRATSDRIEPDHRVDVRITMPACSGARVRTGGGEVTLVGLSGAVQVDTEHGAIELRTDAPMVAPVALTTGKGNIYYQAPPGSSGRFDVASTDGEAVWECVAWESAVAPMRGARGRFEVTLNAGENPVLLRTGGGDAQVMIIPGAQGRVRAIR